MKFIVFVLLAICVSAKKIEYLDRETYYGQFQMYVRNDCYYTSNYPGFQSMKPTWNDDWQMPTLLLYTDTNCRSGETSRDFEYGFTLRDRAKKRIGWQSCNDTKCKHHRLADGIHYSDQCFQSSPYEEFVNIPKKYQIDEHDDWLVLNKYSDNACTVFVSQERIYPCDKCYYDKYGICGASYTLVLLVFMIIFFLL